MEADDKTMPSGDESARLILDNEKPPDYTIDIEKAADPQEQSQENKGRQFLIWTVINTLATIAIVSSSHDAYRDSHHLGLHEQRDLQGSFLAQESVDICSFPLRCNDWNVMVPIEAERWHVYALASIFRRDAATRRCHVPQRHLAEPVVEFLVRGVLPIGPGLAHTVDCYYQFRVLRHRHASTSCIFASANMSWGRNHVVL
jgi:hypothetical protein